MNAPKTTVLSQTKAKQPMSTAALQIVQAAVRENVSISDLSKLALVDPGFALRLLAVVNSAAFKRSSEVRDVQQAALLLGIRGMRNIALSLAVTDLVPLGEGSKVILANSIRRAVSARLIGKALGLRELDGYFTMGLLLESGLLLRAREDLAGAAAIARAPAANRVIHERAAGFVPHPESGAEMARSYQLAPELVEAIRHHHDAQMPAEKALQVAWLAERASGVFECVDAVRSRLELLTQAATLGIAEATMDEILDEIPKEVAATAEAFDRDLGPQLDLAKLRDDVNARLIEMNQQYQEMLGTLERLLTEKTDLAVRLEVANQSLEHLVATDALTGLPNRRMLEQALARDMASAIRNNTPLSIAVLDVDKFGNFNATHGHAAGDLALQKVSQVLTEAIRQSDLAARYGGEEFVLLFPRTDAEGALVVCERVRAALAKGGVALDGCTVALTASLGVATLKSGENSKALFVRADAALYEAKRLGRNQVQIAP